MTTVTRSAAAPIRAGFLGGGFMASVHSRAERAAGARLEAIASSTPSRSAEAASRLGIETAAASVDELLASGLDLVHVVTPNATHAELALAALDAGSHVICEKPLATTVGDAQLLVSAASASGLIGAVPFVYRYHPMVREARARVARGDLGRLLTLRGSYLQDWLLGESDDDWRVDSVQGGASRAFADVGSHLSDLLEFITGDRIVRLAATKRTFVSDRAQHSAVETEDAAALVVETAGGAIGTLLVSQMAPGRKNQLAIEIAGTAESIAFDQEHPESLWLGRRIGSEILPREAAILSPDAARLSVLPAGHPLGYQDAFTAFVADVHAAIRGEAPDGLPTFDDGLRAAILTDAVLRSSADGAWTDVSQATPQEARS